MAVSITDYKKQLLIASMQHFPIRLRGISVQTAVDLLIDMGCGDDTIEWHQSNSISGTWTPVQIGYTISENFQRKTACSIGIISFIGGPPGIVKIYDGSLLTLLLDRIYLRVMTGGLEALDGLNGIWEVYI